MESTEKSLSFVRDTLSAMIADVYNHHSSFVKRPLDNCQRDVDYIQARCSQEGLSFFTKTLPQLGKALDRALEEGSFVRPRAFSARKRQVIVPKFLWPLFLLVFFPNGELRPDACPYVIADLRTLLFFSYKLETGTSASAAALAVKGLVEREEALRNLRRDSFRCGAARAMVTEFFKGFDPYDILPKHGPGAVADKSMTQDRKCNFSTYYSGLNSQYPYSEYFGMSAFEVTDLVSRSPVGAEPISRVVMVPKDSRGPRVISCEPLEYQYIQQGIMRKLYTYIESHPFTESRINFADQSVNGELALRSSLTREYSTLDLKEASDMVSLRLVEYLFADTSLLLPLLCTRSRKTLLPDGSTLNLLKFAPMGSALCFPIEALVFFFLVKGAIHEAGFPDDANACYVYGDDIIVKTEYFDLAIKALTEAHLLVNRDKSFTRGFFRESCGVDAYRGVDVTPLRLRKVAIKAGESSALEALVDLGNALFDRCYHRAARVVKKYTESILRVSLPYTRSKRGFLSWVDPRSSSLRMKVRRKWNSETCRHDMRVLGHRDRTHLMGSDSEVGEWAEYNRKLTQGFSPDYKASRYNDGKIRLRWIWVPLEEVARV